MSVLLPRLSRSDLRSRLLKQGEPLPPTPNPRKGVDGGGIAGVADSTHPSPGKNDCSVVALEALSSLDRDEAEAAAREQGWIPGEQSPSTVAVIGLLRARLGEPKEVLGTESMRLDEFVRGPGREGRWAIFFDGHVVAAIDGQTGNAEGWEAAIVQIAFRW